MSTFDIKNITPNLQEMTMTVFYEFSTGDIFSNKVPATTPVTEILQWGQDKCTWFDEREVMIAEMRRQIEEARLAEEARLLEEQNNPITE
jgi:hypothetical protein